MKVIGIIGGIGSGKSTVAALLEKFIPMTVISADVIGHEILLKGGGAYEAIKKAFGEAILDEEGEIIRKRLGKIVFDNQEALELLNSITHPLIKEEIGRRIQLSQQNAPDHLILLEAALLLEAGLDKMVDVIIAVYVDDEKRLGRVMQRDQLTRGEVLKRFNAQKKWEQLEQVADEIIDNSISLEETTMQVRALAERLRTM